MFSNKLDINGYYNIHVWSRLNTHSLTLKIDIDYHIYYSTV